MLIIEKEIMYSNWNLEVLFHFGKQLLIFNLV